MSSETASINDVSDTALWVAHYRAIESERPEPLFRDRFAQILTGERGRKIAETMQATSRYTEWHVVLRTHVIDRFIRELVSQGVDMVINLGAGLDTRPYRMDLPKSLKWVEVDFPQIINHKNTLLAAEAPQVQLERIALDLSNEKLRQGLFAQLGAQGKNILVLTEGVIPYLSEEQVASLATSLHKEKNFNYWIAEYISSEIYHVYKTRGHAQRLRNSPFQFFPADWFAFFKRYGWQPKEVQYLAEETIKLGRPMPYPWYIKLILLFVPKKAGAKHLRQIGYVLFVKN